MQIKIIKFVWGSVCTATLQNMEHVFIYIVNTQTLVGCQLWERKYEYAWLLVMNLQETAVLTAAIFNLKQLIMLWADDPEQSSSHRLSCNHQLWNTFANVFNLWDPWIYDEKRVLLFDEQHQKLGEFTRLNIQRPHWRVDSWRLVFSLHLQPLEDCGLWKSSTSAP